MTKQDYVLIANILKDCRALGYNYDTLDLVCATFAKHLSVQNVRFDVDKFLTACGCAQ